MITSISQYPTLLASLKELSSEKERTAHLRNLCRIDLYFLLRYVLNRPDVENEWIFERCREVQANPNGYLDLWSRGHYKSSIITFGKNIQDILASHGDDPLPEWQGREITIGIFSHTRPAAKGFLRQIMRELENNEMLKNLFPDVFWEDPKKQAPKWSEDDGIIVKRKSNPKEASLEAHGLVDGMPTGKHFFIRNYDDVVTIDSVRTSDMIKKTTESWEISLNLSVEDGLERYIGTYYADGDTYHEIIARGAAKPRIHPGTIDGTAAGEPVFWDKETIERKRKEMGPHVFSTQILLDPIPSDNAYFKESWFQWYDTPPKHLNIYGASDYAVTEGDGDWTEHGIMGVDPNDDLYLLDWWSGQTSSDHWIEEQLDLIRKWKPQRWVSESGPIRQAIEPFLKKRMNERKDWCWLNWLPSVADKPTRATSFQAIAASEKVFLPKTPWAEDLLRQLLRFPIGQVDDKVDVCSLFGRILHKIYAASVPKEKTKPITQGRVIYNFETMQDMIDFKKKQRLGEDC